jgi:uncharacterized protein
MRREMLLFEEAGPKNTQATLEGARSRAEELGIRHIVVATSTGDTVLKALDAFEGMEVDIVGVTLLAGYWQVYAAPDGAKLEQARARGARFLTATHTLMGNVEGAIREKFGGLPPVEIIAHTYYTFSQGMKVAVEVATGAADAGLVPTDQEIIALGGTNSGCDTAIVLRAACSIRFFETSIREVIAMPR